MKEIPFLSITTNLNKFFDNIQPGETFKFSTCYDFEYVIKIAANRGVIVKYCRSESTKYLNYGYASRIMKVIKNNLHDSQIFQFDPKYLDIKGATWNIN